MDDVAWRNLFHISQYRNVLIYGKEEKAHDLISIKN